jgi:hypothetical protein
MSTELVTDRDALGADALTTVRRTEALIKCLANRWADRRIVRVERVDEAGVHGWRGVFDDAPPSPGLRRPRT